MIQHLPEEPRLSSSNVRTWSIVQQCRRSWFGVHCDAGFAINGEAPEVQLYAIARFDQLLENAAKMLTRFLEA
jgi:hypothetical protein